MLTQGPITLAGLKENPMFLIVNLMFVVAAGLMVLVVAATASLPRPDTATETGESH